MQHILARFFLLCSTLALQFPGNTSYHAEGSDNLDHLPSWFHENDHLFVFPLGPYLIENSKVPHHGLRLFAFGMAIEITDRCKRVPGSGFTVFNCQPGHEITIKSLATEAEYSFQPHNFPLAVCNKNSLVYSYIQTSHAVTKGGNMTMTVVAATAHRLYCPKTDESPATVVESWDQRQEKAGCVVLGMTEQTAECRHEAPSSCSVHIERDSRGGSDLYVVLDGTGVISVLTYNKAEVHDCVMECCFSIGDAKDVTVRCPDGSEHKLFAEQDLTDRCPLSQYRFIGTFSAYLCRSTYLPSLFWVLLAWIFFGKFILLFISMICSFVLSYFRRCLEKRKIVTDLERGCCDVCHEMIVGHSLVSNHLGCSSGICPYCKKTVGLDKIKYHPTSCPSKLRIIDSEIHRELKEIKIITRLAGFEHYILSVKLNTFVYYIIMVSMLLVLISPVGASKHKHHSGSISMVGKVAAEELGNTTSENRHFLKDDVQECYDDETLPQCFKHNDGVVPFSGFLKSPQPSLFEQLSSEAYLCGDSCWHTETECMCPKTRNESLFDLLQNKTEILNRHKRETTEGQEPIEHSPSLFSHYMRHRNRPIRVGKRLITGSKLKDALGGTGSSESEKTYKPFTSQRHIKLTWNSYQRKKDKILVKGLSTGELDVKQNEGIIWEISSPESEEKIELTVSIKEAQQLYVVEEQYITFDRVINTALRATCTGDCPTNCGLTEIKDRKTHTHMQKWDGDRSWVCNPTWCWGIGTGCTCCAAYLTQEKGDWVAELLKVRYSATELIVCIQLTNKKKNCQKLSDSGQIKLPNVKIGLSKVFGIDTKLPTRIATVYHKSLPKSLFHPDFIWLDPDLCDSNCNHGHPGDVKVEPNKFKTLTSSATMTWKGLDISHTCRSGDWPECNFHSLVKHNGDAFEKLNRSSEHITSRFLSTIVSASGVRTLPIDGAGMAQFTVEVTGLELTAKKIELTVEEFKILDCKGCFGCSSGFECGFKLVSKTLSVFHLISKDDLLLLSKQSLEPGFGVFRGYVLINISDFEVCIEELPSLCRKVEKLSLTRVEKILVENDDITHNILTESSNCGGLALFSCAASSAGSFFSGMWSWISKFWAVALAIVGAILLLIFLYCLLRFLCTRPRRNVFVKASVLREEDMNSTKSK